MAMEKYRRKLSNTLKIKNSLIREMLAEALGTFILIVFGNGAVAQSVLTYSERGGFISINWGYGIGVTMGVFVAGGVSGAHINPAVTVAMAVAGKLPLWKAPFYIIAQIFGGFMSGAAVFSVYYDALNNFDGGVRQVLGVNGTAGIFSTYPQDFLSQSNGLWDQVFATAVLVGLIFAITDKYNNKVADGLAPFVIGLVVVAIGIAYGANSGYAVNPARDFGPRLFTAVAGWGTAVFTEPKETGPWWWIPIVGPTIGGVLGALVYLLMVGNHFPEEENEGKAQGGDDEGVYVMNATSSQSLTPAQDNYNHASL